MCSEFFDWFKKKRSDFFVESVIQSAREGSDLCGLYYQNDVESLHHVEKMNQSFEKKTVKEAIGNIQKLSDRQDSEEVRAIYGAGSYILSTSYKQFLCQVLPGITGPLSEKKTMSKSFEITSKMFLRTLRNQKMLAGNPTMLKE